MLRRWCRPHEILTKGEAGRSGEFVELFASQLEVLKAGPEPTIVQRMCARRMAETLWAFDRITSSRATVERRSSAFRSVERQDEFEEFGVRGRLNMLAIEELDSAMALAQTAAGVAMANVVPFKAKSTKKRETG